MSASLYLAGPVLHQTGPQANNWRTKGIYMLAQHGITGISPLRDEPLVGLVYGAGSSSDPRHSGRGILEKNLMDIRMCDATLAFLPVPQPGRHQSFGTLGEVWAARIIGKPVIIVTDDPDVLEHSVTLACAGWVVPTLSEGLAIAVGLLSQHGGR